MRFEALEEWRLAPAVAEALFLAPLAGTLAFVATRLDKGFFLSLTREDGLLEWLQVLGFAAGAAVALLSVRLLLRRGDTAVAALYALFALGCIFFAGEEISWGQRLLGLETPEGLRGVNYQEEITAHNVVGVRAALKLLVLVLTVYAIVGAPLVRRLARRRPRELARLLAPPVFLTSAFAVVLGYNLVRLVVYPTTYFTRPGENHTVTRTSEWVELCLAYGLACFALLSWRRLRLLRSP